MGAWRVTFPDGRSGKFYFKDVAPDGMSSSLIPSFDKTQEVVGIHYRGSNVKTVDACANAAHLSF